MSETSNATAQERAHHDAAPSHGTLKGYLTGFALAAALTAVAFWLVMARPIASGNVTALLLMALAVAQIVVHMIYFLHMDTRSEGGWTMLALIFTLVLVAIALSGTLWVMHNLNANMMPRMSDRAMSQMP